MTLRAFINGAEPYQPPESAADDPRPEPPSRTDGEPTAGWIMPPAISEDEMRVARLTPRCIVENYLFADVAALVAPGSTGKTTMTLYEAICIVLGLSLWGLRVFTPGPVVIVTAEDRREFLVARLREITKAMNLSDVQMQTVRDLVRIDDRTTSIRRLTLVVDDSVTASAFATDIVRGCKAAGIAPVLVQFDPMVSFGVGEARVNDAEHALVEAARVISNGLDCGVRYVHHTGKANAREKTVDQYSGRGGSAFADGCRMVAVMHAVDDAELLKATGEHLTHEQSAFALDRPKLSYAPPQKASIYVRRAGYSFEMLSVRAPQTGDARARTIGEQLARFLESELTTGRKHTRHTLEDLKPDTLSRQDVRIGLAWLAASGMLIEADVIGPDGKRPAKGARIYLQPVRANSGEPWRSENHELL